MNMRFKGTWILLLTCLLVAVFIYFYEIRGGEQRTKTKEGENVVWKIPSDDVQQLDLVTPEQHITAIRSGERGVADHSSAPH